MRGVSDQREGVLTACTALIERAQFAHNPIMYSADGFADVLHDDTFKGSWLEWILKETESSHGQSLSG